jgi:hypothetical protein
MSFLQIILIANIIVLCAYLIHLWDICPYREKTNQNVLIKAIIDTSKANVAITVVISHFLFSDNHSGLKTLYFSPF